MAVKNTPPKMLVAKQRHVTVYFTPEELQVQKKAIQADIDQTGIEKSHGGILKTLDHFWLIDPSLRARVNAYHKAMLKKS